MSNTLTPLVLAGVIFVGTAVAGCQGDRRQLAEMANKQLYISSLWAPGGSVLVNLDADGCPVLDPDGLEATLNEHPMAIDPGHLGTEGEGGWCYQATFRLEPLPGDIGSTITIVIRDPSETLRMVLSDVHAHPPVLEPAGNDARRVHPGDQLSIGFTSPDGLPDTANASIFQDMRTADGPTFTNEYRQPVTLADDHVTLEIPSLNPGPAWVSACVSFSQQAFVSDCQNAACVLGDPWSRGCDRYNLDVQP
jgi:hypothetical protein